MRVDEGEPLGDQPAASGAAPVDRHASYALDIAANRCGRKWSRGEMARRVLWEILRGPFFAWTPRPFWGWRRGFLRLFGAEVGRQVCIHPTARIAIPWNLRIGDMASVGDRAIIYNLGPVDVGRAATISQNAHLCAGTHDYRRADMLLLKMPIVIGEGAWICADAFVGPGATVGAFSIVGARAVVLKSVPDGVIVAGNPARVLRTRPAISK